MSSNIKSFKLDILNENDRKKIKNLEFDIAINNASIGDSGSVCEIDISRFKSVFETNVFANILTTQEEIKVLMNKNNKCGRIVFVSSLFGRISFPFLSPYCSSKFAIEGFASVLKKELKQIPSSNLEVAIIEPGAYHTGFNQKNISKKYEWMKKHSYFKEILPKIKLREENIFNFLELKKLDSIVKQYIHVVEDPSLKLRYTAPKYQAFFIQLGRIFGM